MKTKKLLVVLILCALAVFLSACGQLVPSGIITLDPQTGGGTAAFTMSVPKNAVEGVGNNFVFLNEAGENTNMGYVTDPQAVVALFQSAVPEGYEVSMNEVVTLTTKTDEFGDEIEEDVGSYDYTITFPFENAEDYNAKLLALAPQENWEKAMGANGWNSIGQLEVTTGEDASAKIDARVLEVLSRWAFTVYSKDTTGAVIDGGNGFDYQYVHNMDKGSLTLVLGEEKTEAPYNGSKPEVVVGNTAP